MVKEIITEELTTLNLPFEKAMEELEQIVKALEQGSIELDKAIVLYSRGKELKDYCGKKLAQAKLKVEKIIHENGQALSTEESAYE